MDRTIRRAVLDRLAAFDGLAAYPGTDPPVPTARAQIRQMTASLRTLLAEHQPDRRGRCPVCSGWLRHRTWPCRVWTAAQRHLIGDVADGGGSGDGSEHAGEPPGPPRDVQVRARGPAGLEDDAPEVPEPRIHRASVIERSQAMPRPRIRRRPPG